MYKFSKHISAGIMIAVLLFAGCDTTPTNQEDNKITTPQTIEGQYIVVLEDDNSFTKSAPKINYKERVASDNGFDRTAVIESSIDLMKTAKIDPEKSVKNYYSHTIQGFTVEATDQQLEILKNDPRVMYVEADKKVELPPFKIYDGSYPAGLKTDSNTQQKSANNGDGDRLSADYTPWGITRVGGAVDGSGEFAWVIDTGIDLDHSDLNVNTSYSASFVASESSPNDYNGHGTHVAGTIGAKSNGFGVVGVSPNTTLFAVKVLDQNGSGSYSDIIAGLDYVAQYAYPGEVANLSLGGGISTALDDAVRNCADQGVRVSLAAGNDSDDANNYSPARVEYNNVWTVSAIDQNDNFASFSNYGNPPIEWAAPGVGIWSTWINDDYNKIDGTSMASPHVGGLLTTGGIVSDGYANGDPDGNPDPISYRQ